MKRKLLHKPNQLYKKKEYRIKIFSVFFFFIVGLTTAQAQYTAIPDTAFEQTLITKGIDSGALDGQVLTADIAGVRTLNIQGGSIKDLTGIKDFASLQELYLNYQQLTSLDLSGMTTLHVVQLYGNDLTSINLNGLSNLEFLTCGSNELTTLDLTGLANLTYLACGQNSLTSLNLAGLSKLETFQCNENKITSLDVSGLINLTTLNFGANQLTRVDVSGLTKLRELSCYQNQLSELKLDGLTSLVNLYCNNNNLAVLDISNKPNLQYFYSPDNPALTCIIVDNVANANNQINAENWVKDDVAGFSLACSPKATATQTFCNGATVADLVATGDTIKWYADATGGSALVSTTVLISGNYYASQTVNGNESDRTSVAVVVNTTPLPSRNMAVNGTLCRPSTYATLASKFNNPGTIKIYATETSITPLDGSLEITPVNSVLTLYITQTLNGCESARLMDTQTVVNANFEPTAADQTFCQRNSPTVANLVATTNGGGSTIKWYLTATSVTPLVSTRALQTRDYYVTQTAYPCGESPRKKVSVTVNNQKDTDIYTCSSYTWPVNGVTYTESSSVSFDDGCTVHNLELTIVPVDVPVIHSQFRLTGATIADISTQGQLIQWYADATGGNPLASNTPLESKTYYATQSEYFSDTNTQCESERVAVDMTIGAIPAGYTFIPDERFEQKLIDLGYDDVIDNKVLTANIDTVTSLNLTARSIRDLTGIKDFKSLVALDLIYNSITNLDVSGMTSLESIRAYGNYSSTVNLTGLTHLKEINFGNSALKELNLSGLTALQKIEVSGPITHLDLNDQVNLTDLNCRYTNITGLNLKNKPNLVNMNASQIASLTCITVDDIAAANANTNWSKDAQANYSLGTTNTTTESACDSFTWSVNNVTYNKSGKYSYVNDCLTEELNVIIHPTVVIDKTITACGSYVWDFNGQTYTQSGVYTVSGATPCESGTLNLTITPLIVPAFTPIPAICKGTTLSDLPIISNNGIGGTWSPAINNHVTTTYTFVPEVNSCAVQTTLEIVVDPEIDATVEYSNGVLSSNTSNAIYQWIDCNGNLPVSGATNQIFTPTSSGSYSVVITSGSCSVTSDCKFVTTLGRADFDPNAIFKVYPNPSHDIFTIQSDSNAKLEVFDTLGKQLKAEDIIQGNSKLDMSKYPTGIYLLKITNENNQTKAVKVVKN
ncbi:T9SS type A sorting domain-containing protein [Flavobacterium sp.]|uniref:Ig-like domain-containing protein n=1 Tax=Flavobacterium sp. TaxID=239 RepID=UPI003D09E1CC